MRILYVINTGLLGGLQRHVLTLMRALMGVAETAVVVNTIIDDKVIPMFEEAGMKTYCLNGKSGHDWQVIGAFKKVLDDFKPDIIHAHGLPLLVSVALRLGLYGKIPVVHSLHCPTGKPNWKNRLVMNCIERYVVNYWLPVSGATWEGFKRVYPWAKGEVFFNPLLLDSKDDNKLKSQFDYNEEKMGGGFIIGLIGRFADQKDWGSFVKVIGMVGRKDPEKGWYDFSQVAKDQEREFEVWGVGVTREEAVAQFGTDADCVQWKGLQQNGREWIRKMDLFVLTSKHEEMPTVVLECFAETTAICGFIPVGGMSEILQFSKGPLKSVFIAERDCAKLAEIVKRIMQDDVLRQAVIDDGRQILEEHFDAVKNCQGRLMEIYRRFL